MEDTITLEKALELVNEALNFDDLEDVLRTYFGRSFSYMCKREFKKVPVIEEMFEHLSSTEEATAFELNT